MTVNYIKECKEFNFQLPFKLPVEPPLHKKPIWEFFKMAADLEIFKRLYLFSLTSYGLITGLADFSFTERCYWYLQSALTPYLKAAPLSVEKPDLTDFLQILFLLSLSSLRRASPVLSEPLELVSSQFFSAWVEDVQRQGQKKKQDIFCL